MWRGQTSFHGVERRRLVQSVSTIDSIGELQEVALSTFAPVTPDVMVRMEQQGGQSSIMAKHDSTTCALPALLHGGELGEHGSLRSTEAGGVMS